MIMISNYYTTPIGNDALSSVIFHLRTNERFKVSNFEFPTTVCLKNIYKAWTLSYKEDVDAVVGVERPNRNNSDYLAVFSETASDRQSLLIKEDLKNASYILLSISNVCFHHQLKLTGKPLQNINIYKPV